ncbi:MAG: MoaD/ThiS family protein [Candidatus Sericytochromatia bacterium]|jgi:molybdopterin converting factor subunit 1|nr:MoaD/ThiS family protein [Candidatus Sericytochromatia bacterium]
MKIQLKTFAQLREKTGAALHTLELSEDATLASCLDVFLALFPALEHDLNHCRTALNQSYVRDLNTQLHEGDEVALIPPVSGG